MRWRALLTENEVVPLLEANGIVYHLEFGTAFIRTGDLCGNCHDRDVLARKVVSRKISEVRDCCV